jgi:molybdate transport system substrate-binding protein
MKESFAALGVSAPVVGALDRRGFHAPFAVQTLVLPDALAGVDVLGPLPPAIQSFTVFVAATCRASKRPDAAREVLAFLASPAADAAKGRHGLAPAHAAEGCEPFAARAAN